MRFDCIFECTKNAFRLQAVPLVGQISFEVEMSSVWPLADETFELLVKLVRFVIVVAKPRGYSHS